MSEQQFEINRVYVKDISVEAPNTPAIFQKKWEPEISLNLANEAQALDEAEELFEVSVTVTVTAEVAEKTAYVVEVEQAGIFTLKGFDEAQKAYAIGAMIPNVLFPYARETISNLSQKAGFPAMLLNPIDFNGLYQQHIKGKSAQTDENNTDEQDASATEETKH